MDSPERILNFSDNGNNMGGTSQNRALRGGIHGSQRDAWSNLVRRPTPRVAQCPGP
ncbi:hypothetical protein SBA2_840016 [Acidobacteriia bacterium SbA2]|nr:hypothetical protein SBA2_840016 [Acidobacteriia bacterium SbA2]